MASANSKSEYSENYLERPGEYMPNGIRSFLAKTYHDQPDDLKDERLRVFFTNIHYKLNKKNTTNKLIFLKIKNFIHSHYNEFFDFRGEGDIRSFFKIPQESSSRWTIRIYPNKSQAYRLENTHFKNVMKFEEIIEELIENGFKLTYLFDYQPAFTAKFWAHYESGFNYVRISYEIEPMDDTFDTKPARGIPLAQAGGKRNIITKRKNRNIKQVKRSLKTRKHKRSYRK